MSEKWAKSKYFGDLFAGLNAEKDHALYLNLIHVIRRIAFVAIAMYLHSSYWTQAICFVVQSSWVMVLLVDVKPFADSTQNRIEIFNEIAILLLGYHMIISAGFNIPNFHRTCVGISAVCLILMLITVNVTRWAFFVAHAIKLRHRRRQHRKRLLAISKKRVDA